MNPDTLPPGLQLWLQSQGPWASQHRAWPCGGKAARSRGRQEPGPREHGGRWGVPQGRGKARQWSEEANVLTLVLDILPASSQGGLRIKYTF